MSSSSEAGNLIDRIRAGDREAAADFAVRFGPMIRRRLRSTLGDGMRRVFDSEDILSTVLRRLDVFVRAQRVLATTDEEFFALVMRISRNALIDKARAAARLRNVEQDDEVLARAMLRTSGMDGEVALADGAFEGMVERSMSVLEDEVDRRLLWLWLTGYTHAVSAALLDSSPDAVRKRWERIRKKLQSLFSDDPHTDKRTSNGESV